MHGLHLIILKTLLITFFLPNGLAAQEPTVVQPFEGSEISAQYAADFDQITILIDDETENETYSRLSIEGITRATLVNGPRDKSVLEISRSFENALQEAGFELLFARPLQATPYPDAGSGSRFWVRDLKDVNGNRTFAPIGDANNVGTILNYLQSASGYYLSARRETPTEEAYFALTISADRSYYRMEEVTRAIMADDTVTISELGVTSDMDAEGKAILYGVQFDVGSAVLRPSSTPSIEIIANVLRERPGNFYVVGHTSDTGSFDLNMQLSQDRAAAIIAALGQDYGIDTARLQPIGVGPAAPLASNKNEAGRQLNRRVELVERLE
ncbi:OmpA family protein [Cognatiyoonia sp. IB215446]|uniref:OmpA family protein n=1 Tax=Cognatiyoonia sp. IB215446 TaxID=3097355 RepID=UPI002A186899|nr:OmpA family protein [Cognatiyoonia sp. IB215446]MDX8349868.1 OmpA family protein [Cognatiyoonia sp. IB215446]